jgi:hypothetical protein
MSRVAWTVIRHIATGAIDAILNVDKLTRGRQSASVSCLSACLEHKALIIEMFSYGCAFLLAGAHDYLRLPVTPLNCPLRLIIFTRQVV